MPATTAANALPYPLLSEPPNGPAAFQSLAEGVEGVLTYPWLNFPMPWGNALGNGTYTAKYVKMGQVCHFAVSVFMGSTTTYTAGWTITLPLTAVNSTMWSVVLTMRDTSPGVTYTGIAEKTTSTVMNMRGWPTAAGAFTSVGPTAPFTWAVGDSFALSGTYQVAP